MSQLPAVGAGAKRDSFYNRYRKAQRFLDDHGMPVPDARIRTVWTRSRVALALAALVLAAADGLFAATGHKGGLVFLFLPVSLGILAAALLTRRTDLVPYAAAALGLVYLIEKGDGDPDIGAAALYAVVLLIVMELVFMAGDRGTGVAWDRPSTVRRWLMLTGLVITSLAAALVVGMVGSAGRLSGAALFGFGVGAAVLALVAVVRFVVTSLR